MIKSFLILIIFPIFLFSSQQIILVIADDFNTTHATLELHEGNRTIFSTSVNIGKNGLAWGLGEISLTQKKGEPLKYEGDNRAPAGIFKLSSIFGYANESNFKMPYLHTSQTLICVDDSNSPFYNQIITQNGDEKSFEYMKRKDKQYELGIVVMHNKNAIKRRGSCIFLHVQREENAPTAGCTSMKLSDIQRVVNWIDKDKNPILIQIPKSSAHEVAKLYPSLKNSL